MDDQAMHAISKWVVTSASALILAAASFGAIAADEISHDKLMNMIQTAKTPADHEAIAKIYDQQAAQDEANANAHNRTASLYRGIDPTAGGRSSGQMAVHCKNIAESYTRAAREHKDLAALHRKLATEIH
jgi:hypothetical protein